jgi:hypothetical protein
VAGPLPAGDVDRDALAALAADGLAVVESGLARLP